MHFLGACSLVRVTQLDPHTARKQHNRQGIVKPNLHLPEEFHPRGFSSLAVVDVAGEDKRIGLVYDPQRAFGI